MRNLKFLDGDVASTLDAVIHQLTVGEASEGDLRDIAWCARQLMDLREPDPEPDHSIPEEGQDYEPCTRRRVARLEAAPLPAIPAEKLEPGILCAVCRRPFRLGEVFYSLTVGVHEHGARPKYSEQAHYHRCCIPPFVAALTESATSNYLSPGEE